MLRFDKDLIRELVIVTSGDDPALISITGKNRSEGYREMVIKKKGMESSEFKDRFLGLHRQIYRVAYSILETKRMRKMRHRRFTSSSGSCVTAR